METNGDFVNNDISLAHEMYKFGNKEHPKFYINKLWYIASPNLI